MDIYENFLEMLEVAIARCGNANKLAEVLGVHPALLTRWKRRERKPSLHQIQPIVDFLGVTWTWPGREDGSGGASARSEEDTAAPRPTGEEVARLKAQLEAEREKTAMLEGLLRDALIAGRRETADAPAASGVKRKGG